MTEYWQELYLFHANTDGYRKRIESAKQTILQFVEKCQSPYISFSGGKDSTVLLGLFRDLGLTDTPVFSQLDDLDWDFTESLMLKITGELGFKNHHFRTPQYSVLGRFAEMDFIDETVTIDTKKCFFDEIDTFVLENRLTGNANGIRIEESKNRRMCILKHGTLFKQTNGFWKCFACGHLTGLDVFAYIISNNLTYAPVYDAHGDFAPHEIRFSWILHPDFLRRGNAAWLKRHFPNEFNKLLSINLKLKCYV
jgi:3'-phosphoadenosine 5'-phosphosulfate sulfotransferase (PAPS reductase)/FAD synthetase